MPKRDRSGWRQPTVFDDDTSAPRVSCVLLRVTQPKHLLERCSLSMDVGLCEAAVAATTTQSSSLTVH